MKPAEFRARSAFIRFQHALESLEKEMNSLRSEMSIESQSELDGMARIARNFFKMANEEIFSRDKKRAASL